MLTLPLLLVRIVDVIAAKDVDRLNHMTSPSPTLEQLLAERALQDRQLGISLRNPPLWQLLFEPQLRQAVDKNSDSESSRQTIDSRPAVQRGGGPRSTGDHRVNRTSSKAIKGPMSPSLDLSASPTHLDYRSVSYQKLFLRPETMAEAAVAAAKTMYLLTRPSHHSQLSAQRRNNNNNNNSSAMIRSAAGMNHDGYFNDAPLGGAGGGGNIADGAGGTLRAPSALNFISHFITKLQSSGHVPVPVGKATPSWTSAGGDLISIHQRLIATLSLIGQADRVGVGSGSGGTQRPRSRHLPNELIAGGGGLRELCDAVIAGALTPASHGQTVGDGHDSRNGSDDLQMRPKRRRHPTEDPSTGADDDNDEYLDDGFESPSLSGVSSPQDLRAADVENVTTLFAYLQHRLVDELQQWVKQWCAPSRDPPYFGIDWAHYHASMLMILGACATSKPLVSGFDPTVTIRGNGGSSLRTQDPELEGHAARTNSSPAKPSPMTTVRDEMNPLQSSDTTASSRAAAASSLLPLELIILADWEKDTAGRRKYTRSAQDIAVLTCAQGPGGFRFEQEHLKYVEGRLQQEEGSFVGVRGVTIPTPKGAPDAVAATSTGNPTDRSTDDITNVSMIPNADGRTEASSTRRHQTEEEMGQVMLPIEGFLETLLCISSAFVSTSSGSAPTETGGSALLQSSGLFIAPSLLSFAQRPNTHHAHTPAGMTSSSSTGSELKSAGNTSHYHHHHHHSTAAGKSEEGERYRVRCFRQRLELLERFTALDPERYDDEEEDHDATGYGASSHATSGYHHHAAAGSHGAGPNAQQLALARLQQQQRVATPAASSDGAMLSMNGPPGSVVELSLSASDLYHLELLLHHVHFFHSLRCFLHWEKTSPKVDDTDHDAQKTRRIDGGSAAVTSGGHDGGFLPRRLPPVLPPMEMMTKLVRDQKKANDQQRPTSPYKIAGGTPKAAIMMSPRSASSTVMATPTLRPSRLSSLLDKREQLQQQRVQQQTEAGISHLATPSTMIVETPPATSALISDEKQPKSSNIEPSTETNTSSSGGAVPRLLPSNPSLFPARLFWKDALKSKNGSSRKSTPIKVPSTAPSLSAMPTNAPATGQSNKSATGSPPTDDGVPERAFEPPVSFHDYLVLTTVHAASPTTTTTTVGPSASSSLDNRAVTPMAAAHECPGRGTDDLLVGYPVIRLFLENTAMSAPSHKKGTPPAAQRPRHKQVLEFGGGTTLEGLLVAGTSGVGGVEAAPPNGSFTLRKGSQVVEGITTTEQLRKAVGWATRAEFDVNEIDQRRRMVKAHALSASAANASMGGRPSSSMLQFPCRVPSPVVNLTSHSSRQSRKSAATGLNASATTELVSGSPHRGSQAVSTSAVSSPNPSRTVSANPSRTPSPNRSPLRHRSKSPRSPASKQGNNPSSRPLSPVRMTSSNQPLPDATTYLRRLMVSPLPIPNSDGKAVGCSGHAKLRSLLRKPVDSSLSSSSGIIEASENQLNSSEPVAMTKMISGAKLSQEDVTQIAETLSFDRLMESGTFRTGSVSRVGSNDGSGRVAPGGIVVPLHRPVIEMRLVWHPEPSAGPTMFRFVA